MKNKKKPLISRVFVLASVSVLLLTLAGCVSQGDESILHETNASVSQKIMEGKTTKEEVKAQFGPPGNTTFFPDGSEVWTYDLTKLHADAATFIPFVGLLAASQSGTKKQLVIYFDTKDVVKRYTMSEAPVTVRTGLLNQ